MIKSKKKKITAFVLAGFMAIGLFGATIASANPHDEPAPPPPHHEQRPHQHWVNGHNDHGHWIDGHWERDR
ncbi:hypothetical protein [Pectinatus brassicae]|uniref:Spy/CpxP family protein refolding chaperone n=1 Tax=Pectinatus brassicae TaxID=862415 RepID=A0A840UW66_9FIRM|nr:hypothetical protein [Pectinatus brassicae]MBB5337133.1 Spy/CpxP family protein refolding chaperone [Pectinatus brassicae]